MHRQLVRIALVAFTLFLMTTAAEAAKGVKKANQGNGHHTVSGIVTRVTPDKTGYGTFYLKTAQSHKKLSAINGAVANVNPQNSQNKEFNVSSATKFEHHAGSAVSIVNAAALHQGQHVRVRFTGQQAEQVHIYTRSRMNGSFMRHRAPVYHAHVHHPHIHHRHR